MVVRRIVTVAVVLAVLAAGVGSAGPPRPDEAVRFDEVYPNPATDDDRGEFVALAVDGPTNLGGLTLTDGETTVRLPARTVDGRIVLTDVPAALPPSVEGTVVQVDALALSNAGERLVLARAGAVVDAVSYENAPEAELLDGGEWRPLGATAVPVTTSRDVFVKVFTLPDAPGPPVETLRRADRRIALAGYTLTSARVTAALTSALRRGVAVHVLVEGSPVGGIAAREAEVLDALSAAGATVTVVGGPRARYDFHHAKYAVVDDRVLVTTENWKPAGTGGRSSRGWGAVVESPTLASDLRDVFEADAGWRDGIPWREFRRGRTVTSRSAANGSYPRRFTPRTARADRVRLLVAPDNAERAVRDLLRSADHTLLVEQLRVEPTSPFLREAVAAARRGVRVRIALSGAWYVREENRALASRLNSLADREGIPLAVRVVEPRSRFEKVHAKGVVVDGDQVLIGSLNWNNHSARENREVALLLDSSEAAGYYERVFLADWRGGAWRLTAGTLGGVGLAVVVALVAGRREVSFALQ